MSEEVSVSDIIIAEDNKVNQYLVTHVLDTGGYSYRVVENGEEAVQAFTEKRPMLVLMDVQMPVMDGLRASEEMRRIEQQGGPRTPIIALTARAQEGDAALCFAAGMDDYIAKPIRPEALLIKIADWLSKEAA